MENFTTPQNIASIPVLNENEVRYRQLPVNLEAEQALLGAILINNRAVEQVADFLKSEHFSDLLHGKIYEAACKQIDRGQEANPTTLKFYFDREIELANPNTGSIFRSTDTRSVGT